MGGKFTGGKVAELYCLGGVTSPTCGENVAGGGVLSFLISSLICSSSKRCLAGIRFIYPFCKLVSYREIYFS